MSNEKQPAAQGPNKANPITKGGLSVQRMRELVNDGASKIKSAGEKQVVPMIGNTGAGKSTTINYLLGGKMKNKGSVRRPKVHLVNPAEEKAKMGHNGEAETIFPQAYGNDGAILYFCDCPGFLENRGMEEMVIVPTATKAAIRIAGGIKGVALVVDYSTITTDRGAGLVNLSKQLGKLFKNPANLNQSILFIITKAPELAISDLKEDIEIIKEARKKTGGTLVNKLASLLGFGADKEQTAEMEKELEVSKQVVSVLELFAHNDYNNVHIINIFDEFESKQRIEEALPTLQLIPASAFSFNDYDTESCKFNEALVQIIEENIALIDERSKLAETIEQKKEKIASFNKTIKVLLENLTLLEETREDDPGKIEKDEKNLRKQILERQEKIAKLNGSRIFVLNEVPKEGQLANYVNAYLIILNNKEEGISCSPTLSLHYVNHDGKNQKCSLSWWNKAEVDKLQAIIDEINAETKIFYTLDDSSRATLEKIAAAANDAKFTWSKSRKSSSLSKNIFFLKELPQAEKDLKRYVGCFLIVRPSNTREFRFFVVDERVIVDVENEVVVDRELIDVADQIEPTVKNRLMRYGVIETDKPLNDILSTEQLSAIYKEITNIFPHENFADSIQLTDRRLNEINQQREQVDSDEAVLYWSDSIATRFTWRWLLGYDTKKSFKCEAGIPIENIEEECQNGAFKDQVVNKDAGSYVSIYQSKASESGYAAVKVYVKKRDIPQNAALIKLLNTEHDNEKRKLNSHKERENSLNEEISSLQAALVRYNNEERTKQKLKLNEHIESNKREITKLEAEIELLKKQLKEADLVCEQSMETFENSLVFVSALGLESDSFYAKSIAKYQEYKEIVQGMALAQYASIFELHRTLCPKNASFDIEAYKSQVTAGLRNNIDIHGVDEEGDNIIHCLVKNGPENLLLFYIQKGISISVYNRKGESPLFTAVRLGNLNALKVFEKCNVAFADQIMADGCTLLHYALQQQQMGIFTWLLQQVPKSKMNDAGYTVLHMAAIQKNEKAIQCLLQTDGPADIFCDRENKHYSVLHQAIKDGNLAAVIYISQYADQEALQNVLRFRFSKEKFYHLHYKAKPNLVDKGQNEIYSLEEQSAERVLEGELPLACAIRSKNIPMIKHLLDINAPHEKLDENNNNALHLAAKCGNKEVLDFLWNTLKATLHTLETQKSYINQLNKKGYVPFHLAIEANNLEAIEWFLAQTVVDKNQRTKPVSKKDQQTPVHLALSSRNDVVAKALIEAKDINLFNPNGAGVAPLVFAKQEKMSESRTLLKDRILMLFVETVGRHLKVYFGKTVQANILTESEKEYLIPIIAERILYYINCEDSKALKKVILNYHLLPTKEVEDISKKISKQFSDKTAIKEQKAILFPACQANDFRVIDELLPACFASLLTTKINHNPINYGYDSSGNLHIPAQEVFKLKKEGFCRALGESLRYLYYVNLALIENQVEPRVSGFSSAMSTFTTITPMLSGLVSKATAADSFGDMKIDLAFSLVNTFFLIVKEWEKARAIAAAQEVVDAFQGGYKMVDTDCIEALTEAFYERFKDQIHQMSISISTNKKLRLHEKDGVVQFAYVIAKRIGAHILQGRNKVIGESQIAICRGMNNLAKLFEQGFQKIFGESQNLTAEQPMPILQRCMLAIWNETDGLNQKVELDAIEGGKNKIWLAGHILTQTGYRLLDEPDRYFVRTGHFDRDIGFCYVTMEEIVARGPSEAITTPINMEAEKQEVRTGTYGLL